MNADLREEYERVLDRVKSTKSYPDNLQNFSLDGYQRTEYKNLKLAEEKLANLVEGYKYADAEAEKLADLVKQLSAKLSSTSSSFDAMLKYICEFVGDNRECLYGMSVDPDNLSKTTIEEKRDMIFKHIKSILYQIKVGHNRQYKQIDQLLEKMYSFNNIDSGFPSGIKFNKPSKPIEEMPMDKKIQTIYECYTSIIEQYEYSNKFLKLQLADSQSKHDCKTVEINSLKAQYEQANHACGEFRDMWVKATNDADKRNLERIEATNALMQTKAEYNQFKTEIFEKSKNATEFDLVSCDFVFSTVKPTSRSKGSSILAPRFGTTGDFGF
jgi:hypothetical protein